MAVLLAAVFWTWLWGPIGLLLSVPLTVCLVVLGRHVPALEFLSILLGDEPALPVHTQFYQRLLAMNYEEATELAEQYATDHSIKELYDEVILPALGLVETDRHRGAMEKERESFVFQALREIVSDFSIRLTRPLAGSNTGNGQILCLPASDQADELAGLMLTQLLEERGVSATLVPSESLASERIATATQGGVACAFISAVPPDALLRARYLAKRLREQSPALNIVAGVWHKDADMSRIRERLGPGLISAIVLTLTQAVEQIVPIASGPSAIKENSFEGSVQRDQQQPAKQRTTQPSR